MKKTKISNLIAVVYLGTNLRSQQMTKTLIHNRYLSLFFCAASYAL